MDTRRGILSVLGDVNRERQAQLAKWGQQIHGHEKWAVILTEEVGEVCHDINEGRTREHMRRELVQVAAVAVAWIEDIDRREGE